MIRLLHGDCLDLLRDLPDNSVDSVVCDPPYGLGFMGKKWDAPGLDWAHEWAVQCHRVLKPGGHLVAFGGTRTVHRLAVAIEDGGFDIRDTISWLYWTGFPKSLDVSKAIDASKGAEREVVGTKRRPDGTMRPNASEWRAGMGYQGNAASPEVVTAPATDLARQWSGYGTALKPAQEPAILARKPLDGTVAGNVERWGTGGLNIDGCRYGYGDPAWPGPQEGPAMGWESPRGGIWSTDPGAVAGLAPTGLGRWPANIYACPKASRAEREAGLTPRTVLCHCTEAELTAWESADRSRDTTSGKAPSAGKATTASTGVGASSWPTDGSGSSTTGPSQPGTKSTTGTTTSSTTGSGTSRSSTPSPTSGSTPGVNSATGSGGSRAASAETSSPSTSSTGTSPGKAGPSTGAADPATSGVWSRTSEPGVTGPRCLRCQLRRTSDGATAVGRIEGSAGLNSPRAGAGRTADTVLNAHNTVKPIALMRWLCRLVTPPGGVVLDPFMGSGTTGIAAAAEGFDFIGMEREADFMKIAAARIDHWTHRPVDVDDEHRPPPPPQVTLW